MTYSWSVSRGRCWSLGRAAALVAVSACSASESGASCPPSPFRSSPPQVIAHGGGEGLGPANTILALSRSVEAGADILDVDVRMTADGVIVATHDRDVSTTTDGSGNIDELMWSEVETFDAREKWTGDPIAEPVRMASLESVLTEFPGVLTSVEIKQVEPSISAELCDVLTRTDSIESVYLSSNEDSAVYEARDRCPGVLITTTYADVDAMRSARETGAAWCAPAPIGQPPYRDDRFSPDDVKWSHDHGMAIFTWTVDDPETLRELAVAGVDGVYTRRPDVAREIFDEVAAG
jgi:glycerophosphoryl diester phosphodiesterase